MITLADKYACPGCGDHRFTVSTTRWDCDGCSETYGTCHGIPRLYKEQTVAEQDHKLRQQMYDGLFGRLYAFLMPFIVLPVRPAHQAWRHWVIYGAVWAALLGLLALGLYAITAPGQVQLALAVFAILALIGFILSGQPYLVHLFLLAIPVKLATKKRRFIPTETFAQVHERALGPLLGSTERLQVLDIATGSCNSLFKHGWMRLNADYTAIDLSETMLSKGLDAMSHSGVAVELVLGDAMKLPFQDATFDVVLNYGAVNGMSDPRTALAEMERVARPGALLLFLDEQMYDGATAVERAYFHRVLSNHNLIHHCPVEWLSDALEDVQVAQVYEFYYICTARKRLASA
jgi:ubiquinone/menaquinone biosynthesis C-methylase UbiE